MDKRTQRIKEIVKEVMGLNIDDYDNSRKINTITEWDSFNNLMLISKIEEEFKVEFKAVEIEETQTIGQFWDLVRNRLGMN